MFTSASLSPGRVYRTRELRAFSTNPTRWAHALVERGEVRRLAPGLYYRPEQTFFGAVPPAEREVLRALLGTDAFVLTGPYYWNALDLGATALWSVALVYNEQRTGDIELAGQRYQLRRIRFPQPPTAEWYVVDFFHHADAAGADPVLAEALLVGALQSGRFDASRLRSAVVEYGRPEVRARIFRALEAAESS